MHPDTLLHLYAQDIRMVISSCIPNEVEFSYRELRAKLRELIERAKESGRAVQAK